MNWYCEEYGIKLWKDIPGFEGKYQVSNIEGEVRSLDRTVKHSVSHTNKKHGKTLTISIGKGNHNYCWVDLWKDGKMKMYTVHDLVARTWVPNPLNLPQINHIDEDKTNNNAANLEWCDCKYNQNYGTRNARISKSRINHPSVSKPCLQFTLDGWFIAEYPSTFEAQRVTGVINTGIAKCCCGKQKTSGGYVWKYKGEAV